MLGHAAVHNVTLGFGFEKICPTSLMKELKKIYICSVRRKEKSLPWMVGGV